MVDGFFSITICDETGGRFRQVHDERVLDAAPGEFLTLTTPVAAEMVQFRVLLLRSTRGPGYF